MKHFTEVLRYLNSIENINCGGCGVVALAVYRWLEKHNKLKDAKIVFLYDYTARRLYDVNYQILNNLSNGIPEGAPHIILERLNKYFDSDGYLKKRCINYKYSSKLIVNAEFLLKALNSNARLGSWNKAFNRKKQIPKIAKKLKIDLSDVAIFN